ncbi:MAG: carboxypeptidase-like regulatory domain-containing protein [Clostridiaceae bacterium]
MWTCKRCETLNEDEQSTCALCDEPRAVKEEQQRTSNKNSFSANNQQSSQSRQDADENNSQKDREPRKKNRIAILIGVLCVLLLAAVVAIVVLVSRQSAYQGVPQVTEPPAIPMETMAPQMNDAGQPVSSSVDDHQIVIDSIYSGTADVVDEFRWGAAIDASGTVWIWDQNDYVARPSDITDAAEIYTAGVDWSARLFVVKKDGSVWWTELYWENKTLNYGLQKISGLENIIDLEIIDSMDLGLLALDAQGQVWVFGNGKYGVFGLGADDNQFETSTAIEGLPPIRKIQCIYNDFEPGYSMVVAQATSGEFYYWGTNLLTSGSKKYSNTPAPIDFATTSSNWSLFESVQVERSAYFAWLDEKGSLSIYENNSQPTDYSELGSFIYQNGGISGLYLLDENGSVYGYGYYTSGCLLTEAFASFMKPAKVNELKDNQSIIAVAFGGWETTALYQDGRIGIWEQSDDINICITDVRFIQDESGGDFKLAMNTSERTVEENNNNGIQIGDVTLTVESTGDYLAKLIPTNETINQSDAYIAGMTYDANTVHVSIDDCRLINKDGIGLGTMLPGALIQLTNLDTQTTWERTQNSDSLIDPFTDLPSGEYRYTVSKAGYITYTSPTFELNYVSGADNEYVWASYSLIEEGSVFSNGFQIQITDLAGNPVASKKFNIISLIACESTEGLNNYSMMTLGDRIDEDGMITSDGWAPTNLYSLKKGSIAIISFDDSLNWSQGTIAGQCILIRAN